MFVANTLKLTFINDKDIPLSLQVETFDRQPCRIGYFSHHSLVLDDFKSKHQEIYLNYFARDSFLELGISSRNAMLTSINLVQLSRWGVGNLPIIPKNTVLGLPVFDLNLWRKKKYIEIDRSVKLLFVDRSALITLDENRMAETAAISENLIFGFADGYPCWILIENLTTEQINHVKKTIEQNSKTF